MAPTAVWSCAGSNPAIRKTHAPPYLVYPLEPGRAWRALGVALWCATALAWLAALGLGWPLVAVLLAWAGVGWFALARQTPAPPGLLGWHAGKGWQSRQRRTCQTLTDLRVLWDGQWLVVLTWLDANGRIQLGWLKQGRCPKRWLALRQTIRWWLRHG